ncbi:MAG TPA: hypothetical protein VMW72_26995 [Sedimentisphaerales bacterium]|nr:hypothetical protein [Sedimentisphaerales bacterium]
MDHESFRQRLFPEHRAVESIERHECVQEGLLAFVPGNMAEGLENAASGGNGQLRRRTIPRVSEELRQVWCSDEAIMRERVVVRTMIRMAPVVHAVGDGLDQLSLPKQRTTLRSQDAKRLCFGQLACAAQCDEGVRHVVGQVKMAQIPLVDLQTGRIEPGCFNRPAGAIDVFGAGQLHIDQQVAFVSHFYCQFTTRISENNADSILGPQLFEQALGILPGNSRWDNSRAYK